MRGAGRHGGCRPVRRTGVPGAGQKIADRPVRRRARPSPDRLAGAGTGAQVRGVIAARSTSHVPPEPVDRGQPHTATVTDGTEERNESAVVALRRAVPAGGSRSTPRRRGRLAGDL
jgi:hypothetical protein